MDRLFTEKDIATLAGVTLSAVRKWRLHRKGPHFIKIGPLVRYPECAVDAWLSDCAAASPHGAALRLRGDKPAGKKRPVQGA